MSAETKRLNSAVPSAVFAANSEKWTFQDETVRRWVERRLRGDVLNACAGETRLHHDGEIHRNDINEERPADTHHNLKELHEHLDRTFDTVVYDPPWSVFQVNDKYDGRGQDTIKQSTLMARAIDELTHSGSVVLGFGYTINMVPTSMNFDLDEVAVFTIPGPGKDFFGSVHVKRNRSLSEFGGASA